MPKLVVMPAAPPTSLYVHIPWCERKCPYCDFNSHARKGALPESDYVRALLDDLDRDLEWAPGRVMHSIFIGGGTPSLLSGGQIRDLLNGIQARVELAPDVEITLEANPGSADVGRFADYRAAGVNRLSIGVQSFNDSQLQALGRVHSADDAIRSVRAARRAGFSNFNLDLMFGLPRQTLAQCRQDLKTAIELEPPHLSCYQLTVEPNTAFHRRPPPLPEDDDVWEMQMQLQQLLGDQGYRQYEVSAYAKPERRCRHNLNYWRFGDYFGIGAGAHGKITRAPGEVTRYSKRKRPDSYLNSAAGNGRLAEYCRVESSALPFEFMLNALRLKDGFAPSLFGDATGLAMSAIRSNLTRHRDAGMISWSDERICPTETGFRFLNTMLGDYL